MLAADLAHKPGEGFSAEAVHGIATHEREATPALQLIPQLFEPDGGAVVPVVGQQSHHLTEHTQTLCPAPAAIHETAHEASKTLSIGHAVDHELGQRFGGIQDQVLLRRRQSLNIEPVCCEAFFEACTMFRRGHDKRRFTGPQTAADKVADGINQEYVGIVELNEVIGIMYVRASRSTYLEAGAAIVARGLPGTERSHGCALLRRKDPIEIPLLDARRSTAQAGRRNSTIANPTPDTYSAHA